MELLLLIIYPPAMGLREQISREKSTAKLLLFLLFYFASDDENERVNLFAICECVPLFVQMCISIGDKGELFLRSERENSSEREQSERERGKGNEDGD
jgi:hypothetical protein